MKLAFVDTETTGLEYDRHHIWEVAILIDDQEWVHQIHTPPGAALTATPEALQIGHFYERFGKDGSPMDRERAALAIATQLAGATLVGSNPEFDARFLDRFLRENHQAPAWNYRMIDVVTLAAGRLGIRPPFSSTQISEAMGVQVDESLRHTALGDARWARDLFNATYAHFEADKRVDTTDPITPTTEYEPLFLKATAALDPT